MNRFPHVQAITADIEILIAATVDPKLADYAVITGVQIHSGAQVLDSLHSESGPRESDLTKAGALLLLSLFSSSFLSIHISKCVLGVIFHV